ncbi:hypothetical protein [Arenibacter sp. S6351L]|uniref:hypothetical protein n=1 Tax=Arenibacter sp. S6351L TaxID=2926407 RepID=UPI001FF0E315|nr:hypothetical protein [Arenibacter sp. S6351L]MCK0137313.1 hypothetical protein [Arenibacter sp. S6351L]
MENIACNLIYNNGDEDIFVGFKQRCEIQNIIYNVEKGRGRWCSQPACSCKKYYKRGFKGPVEDYPCNESTLFETWTWNPGNKFKTGEPFRMLRTGKGKIAILTTCFPSTSESERKIVGFLKIKDLVDDHHQIIGQKNQSLRLTLDEAKELDFWLYHKNNNNSSKPDWKQGRFRYLADEQVATILHDLVQVVQNASTQSMILKLLESDFPDYAIERPIVEGAIKGSYTKKVMLKRKYGKGGESPAHKKLKEYIAKNPSLIGLSSKNFIAKIEHQFISGDLVDILFEPLNGQTNTVVEIELDNVLPGIHQAIKYRVLRCSQLKKPLTYSKIKATIVAWKLNDSERQLCNQYEIDYYEIKL